MKQKIIHPYLNKPNDGLLMYPTLQDKYLIKPYSSYGNSKLSGLNILDMKIKKNSNTNFIENGQYNNYSSDNTYINLVRKVRHSPPSVKEWINSTYVYNNTAKNLPLLDKMLSKLIRSYFNLYNNKLRKKIRKHGSKRFEIRKSRRLMNKIFIGKPELKHSNDNIVITIYVYNAEKKYLINKMQKVAAIYKINTLNNFNKPNENKLKLNKINEAKAIYLKKTKKASIDIKSKLNKYKKSFYILKKIDTKETFNIYRYEKYFFKIYAKKFLRKEIVSNFYKQMLIFNKQKFEIKYAKHLADNIAKIYNKKIQFNFVSLKHIYLDSQIFSMALVTKLRRIARIKKNFLIGLKRFLNMFNVPRINSLNTYNEMFNRQMVNQNINNDNVIALENYFDVIQANTLNKDIVDNTIKIGNFMTHTNITNLKNLSVAHYMTTITKSFNSIKYKIINGIRLEVAGRFTKRSSAARSVFKIRNKGSIKNKDSSYKGLPAILLKGYAKSNLQYNKVYSKVRGGSFGIKG